MLYESNMHVGYCEDMSEGGFAWCAAHTPVQIRDSLNGVRKQRIVSLAPSPVIKCIHGVQKQFISLVAYFEHRWAETNWACSLDVVPI